MELNFVFFHSVYLLFLVIGLKDNKYITLFFQTREKNDVTTLEFYGDYVSEVEKSENKDSIAENIIAQKENNVGADGQEENILANEVTFLEDIGFNFLYIRKEGKLNVENTKEN